MPVGDCLLAVRISKFDSQVFLLPENSKFDVKSENVLVELNGEIPFTGSKDDLLCPNCKHAIMK